MKKLTSKQYWNKAFELAQAQEQYDLSNTVMVRVKGKERKRYPRIYDDYSEYIEWNFLYNRYLPRGKFLTILEVGSAPGDNLVRFHRIFGYIPYGVEYTDAGVQLNRKLFDNNGIEPGNVIHADAFDESFIKANYEKFDIVISRGFIEHFDEPSEVIDMHMALLKPGGTLIISIPRISGMQYFLFKLLNPEIIQLHNRSIMTKGPFQALFRRPDLQQYRCGYHGVLRLPICGASQDSKWRKYILGALKDLQAGLNILMRILFWRFRPEGFLFSPYLLFIGRKRTRDEYS